MLLFNEVDLTNPTYQGKTNLARQAGVEPKCWVLGLLQPTMGAANFNVSILRASAGITYFTADFRLADRPPLNATFSAGVTATTGLRVRFRVPNGGLARGGLTSPSALMLPQNPVAGDICAAALTGAAALSLLRFWGEIAKRGFFDQVLTVWFSMFGVGNFLLWLALAWFGFRENTWKAKGNKNEVLSINNFLLFLFVLFEETDRNLTGTGLTLFFFWWF